jgi:hypothetical protein
MTPADQRALQRDLLLARATAERAALRDQLAGLRARTRSPRGVAGLLFSGARAAHRSGALPLALGVARRQPWLLASLFGAGLKLVRVRAVRWLLVAGAVGAAAWWLLQDETAAAPEDGQIDLAADSELD